MNSVSLYTGRLDYPSCFGTALYLSLSVFDHSCEPNARVEFDGGKAAAVRTIKDIETDASNLEAVIHCVVNFNENVAGALTCNLGS